MHILKKIFMIFTCLLVTLPLFLQTTLAKSISYAPYQGYEYNGYKESTPAPVGYLPGNLINSKDLGLEKEMNKPTDIFYDEKDSVYILDSGNSRIIELSADMKYKAIYDSFYTQDKQVISFEGAQGFAVNTQGDFYIADTKNNRVLVFERSGKLKMTILRPDDALSGTDAPFSVTKIMVDKSNKIYVIAESINIGIMTFSPDGKFLSFFGNNTVKKTAEVIKNFFLKKFLTKEQRKGLSEVTPAVLANMTADAIGFIYTVKAEKTNVVSQDLVKCLNHKGENILDSELLFGDLESDNVTYYHNRKYISFIDVDIDSQGFVNLLDRGRGKVFQYTPNGNLISTMGAYSDQNGTFTDPVALESVGSNIYVLDTSKNCIHSFHTTAYGENLRKAFLLMDTKNLNVTLQAWNDVSKQNSNSRYPYYGIGTIFDEQGLYKQAMAQFRLSDSPNEYSKSFRQYRKEFVKDNFIGIVLVIVALIALVYYLIRIIKKKLILVNGTAFSPLESKYTFPIYTSLHPIDGFDQFKTRKCQSYRLAILLIALWFFAETLSFFCNGFAFNSNRAIDYSLFVTLFKTIGIFILFVAANWSVCTLLNGKGNFKEIFVTTAYALLPYILSILVITILTNILTVEEGVFIGIISTVCILWSALILICGLFSIHQYSFSQTLGAVLLTIIGMIIIAFLTVLFYTLMQQVNNFVTSIMSEAALR